MPTQAPPQEWFDEKQVTRVFGITHTPLFNLRKAGKIRSLSLAGDGQSYGKRLYNLQSIRDFLAGQESRDLAGQSPSRKAARV